MYYFGGIPNFLTDKSRPKRHDLLLTKDGTLGRLALVDDKEICINQSVAILRPNSKVVPKFFQLLMEAPAYQQRMLEDAGGSTIKHIYITIVIRMPIALPSEISKQEAIAAALSDVDALLDGLERLIAKKRDLKQAAMQQLLTGQTHLPGFSGEWDCRPIRSVIEALEAGVSVNSEELGSGEKYILKTSAAGKFFPDEYEAIVEKDLSRARLNPRRDTLLISRMNTPDLVGEVAYVEKDYPHLFLPDRLWLTRFRPGIDFSPRWLAYLLSSDVYKTQLKAVATGTSGSMKNFGKDAFLSIEIRFPKGEEQTAIAAVLSDMDTELSALEAGRDKTRALKQGMMQELLTGRIRLV